MDMTPRLKDAVWERDGERLCLARGSWDRFAIPDPDGTIERLLELLRDGGRTFDELSGALTEPGREMVVQDVATVVWLLDSYRLVEDERRLGRLDRAERERYAANLAFFATFATLRRSREDFQQDLRDAHVLVLGLDGPGRHAVPQLAGLGIGRLTLLDRDVPTARRVLEHDPQVEVAVAALRQPEELAELVERFAPDAVLASLDRPDGPDRADDFLNAACVTRGVPFVRAGLHPTHGLLYSVDPRVSACRACLAVAPGGDQHGATLRRFAGARRADRGIGPAAGLLGALSGFEVLRYLIRYEPPQYAGRPVLVDFAGGCALTPVPEWPRDPACPVCGPDGTTAGGR